MAIQSRRLLIIERSFLKKFRVEYKSMGIQASNDYLDGGIDRVKVGLEGHKHNIRKLYEQMYAVTMESATAFLNEHYGKSYGKKLEKKDIYTSIFSENYTLPQEVTALNTLISYFRTMALEKSRLAGTAAEKVVADIVDEGIQEMQSVPEISKKIKASVPDITKHWAESITRTEIGNANMKTQFEELDDLELPPMAKIWMTHRDSRTRDAHRRANGQTVRKDDYFSVDGERLLYPNDPHGSPKNVINCRCMGAYRPIDEVTLTS